MKSDDVPPLARDVVVAGISLTFQDIRVEHGESTILRSFTSEGSFSHRLNLPFAPSVARVRGS